MSLSFGGSPFAPLRVPAFREIWIANVISNIGGWMQSAGAGWEMVGIAPSPMFVAGMVIATTCPVFLFGFPVGVLADCVDRRLYIVCCQVWMMLASIALTVLAWTGNFMAWSLFALIFCMGIGNAMNGPAWHAVVSEIVPRTVLLAVIALNSAGFNFVCTVGPVIGQVLHGFFGVVVLFAVNFFIFLAIIFAMLSGRCRVRWVADSAAASERRSEGFWQGFMSGLLYVRSECSLWRVWVRGVCFFVPACGFFILLPHFALHDMEIDAAIYGIIFASFGVGVVGGSLLIFWVNRLLGMDRANIIGMLASVVCCVVAVHVVTLLVVGISLAMAGACWMIVIVNNQVTVQSIIFGWVRARAMSVHQMVFFGSLAIGQTIWGLVADHVGVVWTMTAAAGVLVATTALAAMIRLPRARIHISSS